MRVDREPAFILHARSYRETSKLIDLLTPNYGRVRLVARGAGKKPSLQPFVLLEAAWSGNTELKTLRSADVLQPVLLQGAALYSGLYLNEILVRLMQESDSHHILFESYSQTLARLADSTDPEIPLRQFELAMLQSLGYGLDLETDAKSSEPVAADNWYWFEPEKGVHLGQRKATDMRRNWFIGSSLLAIALGDFNELAVRRDAKRLLRLAIDSLLGGKPLQSRQLFVQAVTNPAKKHTKQT